MVTPLLVVGNDHSHVLPERLGVVHLTGVAKLVNYNIIYKTDVGSYQLP